MRPHSVIGFADELTKVAGIGSLTRGLSGLVSDILDSPRYRRAILHAAALGGITGAAGSATSGGDGSALNRVARGAAGGVLGGVITGAVFPSWFTAAARRLR